LSIFSAAFAALNTDWLDAHVNNKKHHLRRDDVYEKTVFLQRSQEPKPYGPRGVRTHDLYLVEVSRNVTRWYYTMKPRHANVTNDYIIR